jgi:hypothetical protein
MNLTITVMPPLNVSDEFKGFWSTYEQPIGIIMGGLQELLRLYRQTYIKNLIWHQASLT